MNSAPATMSTHGMYRCTRRIRGAIQPKNAPNARNHTPRPSEYATSSNPPCSAVPEVAASVSTAPRIGPMHGDHATANVVPMMNERGYPSRSQPRRPAPPAASEVAVTRYSSEMPRSRRRASS